MDQIEGHSNVKSDTIEKIVLSHLCTGCGTCISMCPKSAIKIIKNSRKGVYSPQIDKGDCVLCAVCVKVCPGNEVNLNLLDYLSHSNTIKLNSKLGYYEDCHVGYAIDADIRYNSSSGGLLTAFLIYALENKIIDGALVCRMNKEKPLDPEPFIARSREEIIEASKSKYCPVPANIALNELMKIEGKYAVVGLPCHLHGIRKAEQINQKLKERIVIHCGIFCGTTRSFMATDYLLNQMGLSKDDVEKLAYRGEGWPGKLTLKLKTNRIDKLISVPYVNYYNCTFVAFTPWRCTLCVDHTAELADISFGDAWIEKIKKSDNIGTSLIITRSKKMISILNQMCNENFIKLSIIDDNSAISSQGGVTRKRHYKIRKAVTRLIGRAVPYYYGNVINEKNALFDYFFTLIIYYPRLFLSSNRKLWPILSYYCFTLKKFGGVYRKFYKLFSAER